MRQLVSLAVLALLGLVVKGSDDIWLGVDQKSNLVSINENGDNMFYWLFYSTNSRESDPLVMWLTGGPGCASEVATMFENGPYKFVDDDPSEQTLLGSSNDSDIPALKLNPYTWSSVANLLYVDNPIGTGYSEGKLGDYVTNEDQVAADLHLFLTAWLEENPEFKGRDFWITGESYAGHYIPAISYEMAFNSADIELNFKGSAIGNGWVDPIVQYPQYAEFSHDNGLISDSLYDELTKDYAKCVNLLTKDGEDSTIAFDYCNAQSTKITGNPPKFNVYDYTRPCEGALCYDFSASDVFFNEDVVKSDLGAGSKTWEECDTLVHIKLTSDWDHNLATKVKDVLNAGFQILVYSGDLDYVCNWYGGRAWTEAVDWDYQTEFNNAEFKTWMVNGEAAGELREYENFRFLRVYNAGHMVPMDKPAQALNMLQTFMAGTLEPEFAEKQTFAQ